MDSMAVLTIGHSAHSMDRLIELLQMHSVSMVADIRSTPYSRVAPEFNRNSLAGELKKAAIDYVFLGDELGGRSKLAADYDVGGRVRYDRMASSPFFVRGLNRVLGGAKRHRLALLCAEKDPLECHRTLLVGRELERLGVEIAHIHADGHLELNDAAMSRLLSLHGMQDQALFESRDELISRACELQAQRVAFVDKHLLGTAPAQTV